MRFFIQDWDNNPSGNGGFVDSTTTITINKWFNFVGTWDGETVKYYINGDLQGSSTYTGSITTTNNLIIGTSYNPIYGIDGKMSNVQIFNTALPETGSNSVETLYNNGSPLTSMSGFTSLVSWYKLNASDTYDSSTGNWTIEDHAGSNDGTSSGMTQANLVQSDLSFKTSISPFALSFDSASSAYIDVTNFTLSGDRTVSFWVNFGQTPYGSILEGVDGDNYYPFFGSGNIYLNNDGTATSLSYGTVNANEWYHFCITGDGTTATVYKNGSSLGTLGDKNITVYYLNGKVYGIDWGSGTGKLSNISIWNSALTSSQVSEIYSEGVPQNLLNHSAVSSLVSWWQLGSNSSFNTNWTVLDEKGTNNGTSVNMTEADIVDGVNSYANGLSSGMGGDEVVGSAFGSSANSLSISMDISSRTTDTPS